MRAGYTGSEGWAGEGDREPVRLGAEAMGHVIRSSAAAAAWAALGVAWAGEPEALRTIEARAALLRADALAASKLLDRAEAILKRLAAAAPDLAEDVRKKAEAVAAERAKADKALDAPEAYRAALEEARKTGRPILLIFGREDDGTVQKARSSLERLAALKDRFVLLTLDPGGKDNQPLRARLGAGKNLRTPPFLFFLSSQEEVLEVEQGTLAEDTLRARFAAFLKKHSPIEPARLAKMAAALQEANEQMDAGRCGAAARGYRGLAEVKLDLSIVREAKASLEAIEALASRLLKEAQASAGQKPVAAAAAFLLLRRDFEGAQAAEAAGAELEKIKDRPEVKALLAAGPPPKATPKVATTDDGEEAVAPPAKDTAKEEPPEPAKQGKRRPPPRRADASKSLLSVAKNLIANQRPERAKPLLGRIVKDYPTSDAAIEARELLKDIP